MVESVQLPAVFQNVEDRTENMITNSRVMRLFAVTDEAGNDQALITYAIPSQKWVVQLSGPSEIEYETNFPFRDWAEFRSDMSRIGLNLAFN